MIDIQKIINTYNSGLSIKRIHELYGHTRTTISNILKKNNITLREVQTYCRKYRINENWLDDIDSEIKAYFLGFLCADGCVLETKNEVAMRLKSNDAYILDRFKKEIYLDDRTFNEEERETTFGPSKTVKFVVNNKHFRDRCIELGITPRKTFTLKPIDIPDNLIHHFIRGYFDGDGCIFIKGNGTSVTMLGTNEFLEDIKNNILLNTGIKHIKIRKKSLCKNGMYLYELRICGKYYSKLFERYVYNNSSIYLIRKKEKFSKINLNIKNLKHARFKNETRISEN